MNVEHAIADALRRATDEMRAEIRTLVARQSESLERIASTHAETMRADARANLEREAEALNKHAETLVQWAQKNITAHMEKRAAEVSAKASESIARVEQSAQSMMQSATDSIGRAEAAWKKAQDDAERVAQEREALARERESLERERADAEKAVTMMTMLKDAEVERMTAEREFELRQKRILSELKEERAAMETASDDKYDSIQQRLYAQYPELAEEISRAVESLDADGDTTNG